MINIGWASNAPSAPSGYGQQTKLFTERITRAGHKVAIFANYGVQGAPYQMPDGTMVYPSVADAAQNDVVFGHYQDSRSELVISLYDPHAYNPDVWRQFPWCAWTPVDSTPLLPANKHSLQAARWIWSMSQHGDKQLRDAGFTNVTYVPHGIDTKVFTPRDRIATRAKLSAVWGANVNDKFLVMMNSANKGVPSRKGFYEAFSAFKRFADMHPDAMLYVHSELTGVFQGENLPAIAQMVGIGDGRIVFAPQYQLVCGMLPNDYLAEAYSAADVFLSTSHGEGFGIPIIEAQACGCPVVVTDCSAMTELCLTGRLIPSVTYMPVVGTTWQRSIVDFAVSHLEWAYSQRDNAVLREEARTKVLVYDADTVFATYMQPAIERMAAELYAVPSPKQVLKKRRHATEHSNGKPALAEMVA